jgi:hypothetical protein
MAWSFSQLESFNTCPLQHYEVKVLKNYQEVKHPTTLWGTRGHAALEERVRDGIPLPTEFSYLENFAQSIIAIPGDTHCEYEIACTEKYEPAAFDSPDAWGRGVIDVLKIQGDRAITLDYKFGKVKVSAQLKLMALFVFANFPDVETVVSRFLWIQFRTKTPGEFHREDAERIWPEFRVRVEQLQQAHESGIFVPKPSGLCKAHCVVTSCDFHGKGNRR